MARVRAGGRVRVRARMIRRSCRDWVRVRARVRARARVDALILHQARNPNPKLIPEPNQAEFDVAKRRRG